MYASVHYLAEKVMKSGDVVELKLYDKFIGGSIVKVYKNEGWQGYVRVLLETKEEVTVPVSYLRVIDGNR